MLIMRQNSPLIAALAVLGITPGREVKGVVHAVEGRPPLSFTGTLDYDNGTADTEIIDFNASATLQTNRRVAARLSSSANNPEIHATFTHIEIVFPEAEVQALSGEQWWYLTKDLELRVEKKSGEVERYEIKAARTPAALANGSDSDAATPTYWFDHARNRAVVPLRYPVVVDLKNDNVAIVTSAAGTTAANTGLAADTIVQANVWGVFADHDAAGLSPDEDCECGTDAKEALAASKVAAIRRLL